MRQTNLSLWPLLSFIGGMFVAIGIGSPALAQKIQNNTDTLAFHTPLNNKQLLQLWDQFFSKPKFFSDGRQRELLIPFCLGRSEITEPITGVPLMTLSLVRIISAPTADNQPGYKSYLYFFSMKSFQSNFSLNVENVLPRERFDFIAISVTLKNDTDINIASSSDVLFGATVNFYSNSNYGPLNHNKPIDPMKITYDSATSLEDFGDSFPINFNSDDQSNCPTLPKN